MPAKNIYFNDDTYVKLAYLAEKLGKPIGKIVAEWVEEKLKTVEEVSK